MKAIVLIAVIALTVTSSNFLRNLVVDITLSGFKTKCQKLSKTVVYTTTSSTAPAEIATGADFSIVLKDSASTPVSFASDCTITVQLQTVILPAH